jgi:hypothetical protein
MRMLRMPLFRHRAVRSALHLLGLVRAASSSTVPPPLPGGELLLVQVVHRHGDRSPITPLADRAFWKGQLPSEDELAAAAVTTVQRTVQFEAHPAAGDGTFGTLTSRGLKQMRSVGEELRERYADLVPEIYDARLVKCYSTDVRAAPCSAAREPLHTVPRRLDSTAPTGRRLARRSSRVRSSRPTVCSRASFLARASRKLRSSHSTRA